MNARTLVRIAICTMLVGVAACSAAGSAGAAQTWGKGKIAFISTRDGTGDVFVMHDDGSHQRNLTNGKIAAPDSPAMSPDGQRIAFTAYDDDGDGEIFMIDSDGGKAHQLTKNLESDFAPAWSPDSKKLAYDCSKQSVANLCVINVASRHIKHVTHGDHRVYRPTWSPDGDRIAFSEYDVPANQSELWTVHTNGSHLHRVTNTPTVRELSPTWSPDGKRFAVGTEFGIQLISASTGASIGSAFPGHDPSWSPDGKRIAFYNYDGSDGEIYSAKPDGSGPKNLTDNDVLDFVTAY